MKSTKPKVKQATGLNMQVILYAKGQYGKTNDNLKDLKYLISQYCGLYEEHVSDIDAYSALCSAFAHHGCDNPDILAKVLEEMIGESWTKSIKGMQRKPIHAMLGHMSILPGEVVDLKEKIKGLRFIEAECTEIEDKQLKGTT
jgi:hypothetical protein